MQNNVTPAPEDLRTEYQICQQAADGESLSYWALSGVFLGLSAVVLGNIFYSIFDDGRTLIFKIAVTLLSIGMIVIYFSLKRWLNRANERIRRYYGRMREIEQIRGMMIMNIQHGQMRTSSGMKYFMIIIHVLILFWLLVTAIVWRVQQLRMRKIIGSILKSQNMKYLDRKQGI